MQKQTKQDVRSAAVLKQMKKKVKFRQLTLKLNVKDIDDLAKVGLRRPCTSRRLASESQQ